MLDRDLLETFSVIVEHGSFERAALVLSLSRGAVSQRIRTLEGALAMVLLVRGKPVVPTPQGEILLRHAKALKLLENDTLGALQPGLNGRSPVPVAIAVNADSLATWFRPVIWELLDTQRIALEIIADDHNHTFGRLVRGEVMGCISSEPHAMQGFAATPLGAMQYRCVATPDFVQRYFGEGLSVPAISTAPAVLFDRKDSLHDAYLEKLLQLKVSQYLRHFIPSPVSLLDTILASAGYGLVPRHQTHTLLASGRLVEIAPESDIDLPLYWHHWKLELPLAYEVTRAVTEHARRALQQA
ncbi:MAG: hypothetical protein RL081_139 [Pseudomonadota bacterium]